jgi:nucleotide-binding universal stress UspA family protein
MKILVGYDGSEPARRALDVAKEHARAFKAEKVYVVACLEGFPQDQVKHMAGTEKLLAEAKEVLVKEGLPVETQMLTKSLSAGEGLVDFAKENNVNEVIIGVVRTSKVGKLIFGSTAQFVILNAPCPVQTVK